MTMAYLSSFDLRTIGADTLTLSTAGESNITLNLALFTWPNAFGTTTSIFNHAVSSAFVSMDLYAGQKAPSLPLLSFVNAVEDRLRSLATTATWADPGTLAITIDTTQWLITFSYDHNLTAVEFGSDVNRRLFGFASDFSGDEEFVTGTQVPKYIIVPTIEGASMASVVYEEAPVSSSAYAANGQSYGIGKTTSIQMRRWVQQYEPKGRTFRRFALSVPNEFTYQDLFEEGRTGVPFGVYGGFGEDQYQAYAFRPGQESFHATPATPGNANQFHIPFETYALGRA